MSIFSFFSEKRSDTYKYKTTVFVICLIISSLIWSLIKLAEVNSTRIRIPITYTGTPEGKILTSRIDTTLTIGIRDQGFVLVWVKYFARKKPLNISLADYRLRRTDNSFETTINTSRWSQDFLEQYNLSGNVEYISPDTLNFVFENRVEKTVPVKSNVKLNYQSQYFSLDTLVLQPDSVQVSGLKHDIAAITKIETVPTDFDNLSASINEKIKLQKPNDVATLQIEPQQVQVNLKVEKFTEAEIEIPIEKINSLTPSRIKIFPETVVIRYLVSLDNYSKVTRELFQSTVDLSQISNRESQKLSVNLPESPQFVRVVRLEPEEVDFLIFK
ncbi:MAG TPA: CdaR family protein [Bacteroidales bacterium]|nr:CdaR family protein [Bacteroidales bacterium]